MVANIMIAKTTIVKTRIINCWQDMARELNEQAWQQKQTGR
jgi:hypothetical protein